MEFIETSRQNRGQMNARHKSAAAIPPAAEAYVQGITSGDRAWLGRAITLVESTRADHQELAKQLLDAVLPFAKARPPAIRLGITGVPGVGKSTTIDQLGMNLIERGHRVAVLAVDPTSKRTGGSILGDKTRMNRLSQAAQAFIRPSPTSGTLGGVTRKTRETMVLVEAAGFDVVIVETVGVGQSEVAVADMVDFFLVLLLAGGGDDLQGIKKGVIELADMVAINKADGENKLRAERAASDYRAALNIFTPADAIWHPPVITMSGLTNDGLDLLWGRIIAHREKLTAAGEFEARRQRQAVAWMHDMLEDRLMATIRSKPAVAAELARLEDDVRDGRIVATTAVDRVMNLLGL